MAQWLVKEEPDHYGYNQLERDGKSVPLPLALHPAPFALPLPPILHSPRLALLPPPLGTLPRHLAPTRQKDLRFLQRFDPHRPELHRPDPLPIISRPRQAIMPPGTTARLILAPTVQLLPHERTTSQTTRSSSSNSSRASARGPMPRR